MAADENRRIAGRYSDFCERIANTNPNITGVVLLDNAMLLGSYTRHDAIFPLHEERHSILFSQAEVVLSIAKTNEDLYGEVKNMSK